MRLLTKLLRKTIVLGLAGLGAYKAWEIVSANLDQGRERAARAKDRLGSVVRQAETDVVDASRIAVAEVAEAVADVALGDSTPATEQPSSRTA